MNINAAAEYLFDLECYIVFMVRQLREEVVEKFKQFSVCTSLSL